MTAANCTVRGIYRNLRYGFVHPGSVANTKIAIDGNLCGTLQKPNLFDAGEGVALDPGCGSTLLDETRLSMGGHNCITTRHQSAVLIRNTLMTSDWQSVFGSGQGQRLFELWNSNGRTVLEDSVFHTSLDSLDSPGAVNMCKDQNGNTLWRRVFMMNHGSGDGMIAMQCPQPDNRGGLQGARDQRKCHLTLHNMDGTALKFQDDLGPSPAFGPFFLKNMLLSGSTGARILNFHYRSSRGPDWTQLLFMDTCAFDSDYGIQVKDLTTGAVLNFTVTTAATINGGAFAANFINCFVAPPQYVTHRCQHRRIQSRH